MRYYILRADGTPVPCDSLIAWALWLESSGQERRVAHDQVADGIEVSTVFLGLDHNLLDSGPPILYETMVFGGPHDQLMKRYHTRAEAAAGHRRIVAELRGVLASAGN